MSLSAKKELTTARRRSKNDLPAIFVACGLELLRLGGRLGAITSGTEFFLCRYRQWSKKVVRSMGYSEDTLLWITISWNLRPMCLPTSDPLERNT